MRIYLLRIVLVAFAATSCQHFKPPTPSISRRTAEELMTRIQPGMTLRQVRSIVPHISEGALASSHGGLMYYLELSSEYTILFRVNHHDPSRGASEYERRIIPDAQSVTSYYSDCKLNLSPWLCDGTGKKIFGDHNAW